MPLSYSWPNYAPNSKLDESPKQPEDNSKKMSNIKGNSTLHNGNGNASSENEFSEKGG